jgi:hypothetical protein
LVVAVHDNLPFLKWLETQLSQIFHQSGPATERKVPMMRTLAEKKTLGIAILEPLQGQFH